MARRFAVLLLLILSSVAFSDSATEKRDLYWVSFSFWPANAPTEYFLMQIDSSGKIIRAPRKIYSPALQNEARSAVALSYNPFGRILLHFCGKGRTIWRLLLEESTLRIVSAERTTMETSIVRSLGGTQKPLDNFLAIKKGSERLWAYRLTASGNYDSFNSWPLSPPHIGGFGGGDGFGGSQKVGISSDGRMSWWTQQKKLYVQPLSPDGKISGAASVIGQLHGGASTLGQADITDVLPGNVRFAPFVWAPEDRGGTIYDHVLLRVIDAATAKPLAKATTLLTREYLNYEQSLAVDPQGRFVILADGRNRLLYIGLDAKGRTKGNPIVLVNDSVSSGVDLLKQR